MNFSKKNSTNPVVLVVIAMIVVGFAAYEIGNRHSSETNNQSSSTASVQKVAIAPSGMKYPSGWQEAQQIPQADKDDGVVSEAGRANPTANVVVRVVSGQLDKNFDIKTLPDQTVASLKAGLGGFSLVSKDIVKLGKHDAVSITYKINVGDTTLENTVIIVPTANKTFYVTFAAKPGDFAKITNDIKAIETATLPYIDSHLGA